MRRFAALAFAVLSFAATPARGEVFHRVAAFAPRPEVVSRFIVDADEAQALARAGGGRLRLPIAGGEALGLTLEAVNPIAEDGRVVAHGVLGERVITERPDVFRVRVDDEPDAWGVLSFAGGRAMGSVEARGTRFAIAPEPGGGAHVLVNEAMRNEPRTFECGAEEDAVSSDPRRPERMAAQEALGAPLATPWRLECKIFLDADYELYQNKFGGNLSACVQYLTTLVATVSAIYERDLNLSVVVSLLTVWTTPADPWTGTTLQMQLDEYTGWHQLNRLGQPRTLAHLVSGRSLGGGVAWIDGICNVGRQYAFSQLDAVYSYPTASTTWDVMVFAHEMGHNFGARHTHSCFWQDNGLAPAGALLDSCFTAEDACYSGPTGPAFITPGRGTIMSYCHQGPYGMAGIRLDFHPSCIAWMRAYAQTACLAVSVPQPPRAVIAGPAAEGGTVLDWLAPPNTPGILGYEVLRHTLPFDPNPALVGSPTGTSFHDPAGTTSHFYRVRTVRSADTSKPSGQLKPTACGPGRTLSFPTASSATALVARDFNLDGLLDVALADSAGQRVSVLRGQRCALCEKEYYDPVHYALDFAPRSLATADLDRDGFEDLIAGGSTGSRLTVLRGLGGGNMTFVPVAGVSSPRGVVDLAVGDLDRDGWRDLVFVDGTTDSAWTLPGAEPDGSPVVAFGDLAAYGAGGAASSVAIGDLTGDGHPDLVVGRAGSIARLDGDGVSFTAPVATALASDVTDVAIGDFDHDAVLDVAAAMRAGVVCLRGLGGGALAAPVTALAAGSPAIAIADVTRDGHPDLVAASYGAGQVRHAPGDGSGAFGAQASYPFAATVRAVAIADHDGLGRVAVIAGLGNGAVTVANLACAGFVTGEIDLITPVAGETWITGDSHLLEWTRGDGVIAAEVQASFDDGATWTTVSPWVWGDSYAWKVEGPYTQEARLRVRDALIPSRVALDDGAFTIVPAEAVAVTPGAPAALSLAIAGEHPARGGLAVRFALPSAGAARLELLDVAGRRVENAALGTLAAGEHAHRFSAGLAPGLYLVRLAHGGAQRTMRAVVLE